MMQARGYLRVAGPDGVHEADVVVCAHCQRAVEVSGGPRGRASETGLAYCAPCDALVCALCRAAGGACVPFTARVDAQLEAAVRRRHWSRALGIASLVLLLAVPMSAQDYPPELPPIPSPELVLRSMGWIALDPLPAADVGQPVTIDFVCGRLAGAADQCSAGMTRLQNTLNNSGLGHITVRLLSKVVSAYKSDGNATVDLSRSAVHGDGFADEITTERNRVGADCIVTITTASNACGVAYLSAGVTSCAAVVGQNCIGNSSYEHEVGHNAGTHHDQPNASSGGYSGTSYGWCGVFPDTGTKCGHKDVMAYPQPCGGSRVARFSNPNQFCPTHPTVPFGSATANGYWAWLNRAPVMANFRSPTTPMPVPRPSGVAPVPTLED